MPNLQKFGQIVCLVIICYSFQINGQTNSNISPSAKEYLEKALDIMQKNSLHRKEVDWDSLRRKTFEKAAGAEETVDTWEAIRFALKSIDNHSFLQLSEKGLLEKEEARRKVKSENKPEEKVALSLLSPYRKRRQPEGFIHKVGNCIVPRMVVPLRFFAEMEVMNVYANVLSKFIVEADAKKPCGWIIDLRGNGGGAVFPMLAGVGFLLEEGDASYAVDADGGKTVFFYKDGQSGVREPNGKEIILTKIDGTSYRIKKQMPVAVLIDRGTGSSGETMAVVFRGRANTRFFGEHTAGMSTSTQGFKLSDGANLVLTTAVSVDRNGIVYPSGISPDETIPIGDKVLPPNEDPVIHAALGWLGEQIQ